MNVITSVIYSAIKHGYRMMFYFDSNTARLIVHFYCAALCFWKAHIDRIFFGYAECKSNSTDLEHRLVEHMVFTAIFYRRIKHVLFPSLYIEGNHGIV